MVYLKGMTTFNPIPAPDRQHTDSLKWHACRHGDILPMWVADMDFESPACIREALQQRVDHGVFGYSVAQSRVTEAVIQWSRDRYGWTIQPEWIVWLPGLVPGLNVACRAFASDTGAVATFTPVYPPFLEAPELCGAPLRKIPFRQNADGSWEVDFDTFEERVKAGTRLLLLSHPHNPLSRVFTREELERVADICVRNGVIVCSDEIHCDLILDDTPHSPFASLNHDCQRNSVTLMSPAKTFNTAGLNCGFAVIPSANVRRRYRQAMKGVIPYPNLFGYVACEAAFTSGNPWRLALLNRLRENRNILQTFISEQLPMVHVSPIQATYLAWLDTRWLRKNNTAETFQRGGVMLSDGRCFDGEGFMRLNFGCPETMLLEALQRVKSVFNQLA